jgi:hypothetical protein
MWSGMRGATGATRLHAEGVPNPEDGRADEARHHWLGCRPRPAGDARDAEEQDGGGQYLRRPHTVTSHSPAGRFLFMENP